MRYTCPGPVSLCEKLFGPEESPDGQRIYGILVLDNRSDATRVVERKFGTLAEATNGWFQKYSSNDRCTRFDFNFVYSNDIYCEFAYEVPFGNGSPSEGGACNLPGVASNGLYRPLLDERPGTASGRWRWLGGAGSIAQGSPASLDLGPIAMM